MRRALAVAALVVSVSVAPLVGSACDSGSGGDGGAGSGASGWCPSGSLTGDLQGLQATAVVTLSQSVHFDSDSSTFDGTYIQMGGEVTSDVAYYLFAADLYGDAGYGDMTDVYYGQTFRIHIQLSAAGFVLTTNPFEGLYSTSYVFTCQ